jgi:hypothetical protein
MGRALALGVAGALLGACTRPVIPTARVWFYWIPDTVEGAWIPAAHGGRYTFDSIDGALVVVWAESTLEASQWPGKGVK